MLYAFRDGPIPRRVRENGTVGVMSPRSGRTIPLSILFASKLCGTHVSVTRHALAAPEERPLIAKRVIHELIDDIDGKPAAESIVFALDGVQYEIDLSAANAAKLRDAVAPFVAAATKIGRGGVVSTVRGREVRGRGVTRG